MRARIDAGPGRAARVLFMQAPEGGDEELYRYVGHDGRGWIVTADEVRRQLQRLSE